MKRHLFSLLALCTFCVLFSASKTSKMATTATVPIKTPNYDYMPPESTTKTGVTLALVKPIFARSMKYSECRVFKDFSDHMASDFEEMITKRGYTLRGPFQGADDMVFDDKKTCPLYLQPEILIDMDFSNVYSHTQSNTEFDGTRFVAVNSYWYDGTITLTSRINMLFVEPFSNEKIKTLSISLPQKSILVKSNSRMREDNFYSVFLDHSDAGIINPVIIALEEYYQSCFTTAYKHLDPQEIAIYVKDAQAARDRHK